MNDIPNELILHISSYLDPKYDNIKQTRNRCTMAFVWFTIQ